MSMPSLIASALKPGLSHSTGVTTSDPSVVALLDGAAESLTESLTWRRCDGAAESVTGALDGAAESATDSLDVAAVLSSSEPHAAATGATATISTSSLTRPECLIFPPVACRDGR